MKTLHYSIIWILVVSIALVLIIEFPIYRVPNALIIPSKPHIENNDTLHGLPDSGIGIVFNGILSSRDTPVYVKQGQNFTLIANITSTPTNLPVSLYIDSHVGFTKTNGIDSKLSATKIKTPGQVMIYVSSSKDATPNTYKIMVKANNTLMTMTSDFYVKVIPYNENNGSFSGNVSSYVYGGPLGGVTNRSVNYEVFVYAPDGITMVGKTFSDDHAHYSLQLPAGKYIIYTYNEIKQKYVVSVFAGQNTIFNIISSIHVP